MKEMGRILVIFLEAPWVFFISLNTPLEKGSELMVKKWLNKIKSWWISPTALPLGKPHQKLNPMH